MELAYRVLQVIYIHIYIHLFLKGLLAFLQESRPNVVVAPKITKAPTRSRNLFWFWHSRATRRKSICFPSFSIANYRNLENLELGFL